MRSHDDYALNGNWHYCFDCQTNWSDADGGCRCTEPSEEDEDQDEIELRELDKTTISAVMHEIGRKGGAAGKGIAKPKSAENGKKGGRPRKEAKCAK